MTSPLLMRMALAFTAVGLSTSLDAKVAPAQFSTLVRKADVVVMGKVVGVDTINGVKIARVKVLQSYKGRRLDVLSFVAQPTSLCDISDAATGETAFLLLYSYSDRGHRAEQPFFSPRASQEDLEAGGATNPIFVLMHSGRGRMPVRRIAGQDYVTLRSDDVRLPASIRTVAGPQPKSSHIRSVRLSEIVELMGTSMASVAHPEKQKQP